MPGMNKLSREARAQILGMMVEGMSHPGHHPPDRRQQEHGGRSCWRTPGEAFFDYQDRTLRELTCKRVQVDEIWAFVYAKAKNVTTAKAAPDGAGDCGPGWRSTPIPS